MTRFLMYGALGAMGKTIYNLSLESDDIEMVCGVDLKEEPGFPIPLYKSLSEVKEEYDVIIDFSSAKAVDVLLDFVEQAEKPLVICTTGLSEEQIERIRNLSTAMPVLRSANMSLGINLLSELIKQAAKTLYKEGFDIEIIEQHHNKKKDAPSGTALALADSVNEALDGALTYVYDRHDRHDAREHNELGLSAVRGGSIVGIHDVVFAGADEVITFNHTAYSKAVFGKGALAAAAFLKDAKAGLYDMKDVIKHSR